MRKRIILFNYIGLIILILFSWQTCMANSEFYLGEFTPVEEITSGMILQLAATEEDLVAVEIELENNYFKSEMNQIIAGDRLKIKTTQQEYIIDNTITRINSNELYYNYNNFSLALIFTAKPIDLPGEYKNKLIIRKIYSEGIRAEAVVGREVIVKINPWVKIEKIEAQSKVMIDSSNYSNKNLFSRSIPVVKVASNTDWRLYAVIEAEKNKLVKMLKIIIPNQSVAYTSVRPEGIYLNFEEQLIASGGKTVEDNQYWVEVPCSLSIDDFTKVEAGTIDFPINFYVSKAD